MSAVKERWKCMELGGKSYILPFNLNVMEEVAVRWGGIEALDERLRDPKEGIKNIKWLFMTLINEGIDIENDASGEKRELLTEKQVGRLLGMADLTNLKNTIYDAALAGMPERDPDDDSDGEDGESDPNK